MSSLLVEKSDGIYRVTINRPEARNSLNNDVLHGLLKAFTEINNDSGARAVVLTGAGDRAFCAGGDIKAGNEGDDNPYTQEIPGANHPMVDLYKLVRNCQIPLIARVNGHAMGGGFGLVCMTDLAIVTEQAKLGSPEVKIGLFPMMILAHMFRIVPIRKLYEMCITGRHWTATEAMQDGIINEVVADQAALDQAIDDLLATIRENSPTAIRIGKKTMAACENMGFEQRLAYLQSVLPLMMQTEDAIEGLAAFSEKRKPVWTGR